MWTCCGKVCVCMKPTTDASIKQVDPKESVGLVYEWSEWCLSHEAMNQLLHSVNKLS